MEKFDIRDITFLAILSAVTLIISAPLAIIVVSTNIFALKQLFWAPLYAALMTVGLRKVPKIGSMSLMGLFIATPLSFISIIMGFNIFIGGVIADLLSYIVYRTYENKSAQILGASVYMVATLPGTFLLTLLIRGDSPSNILGNNILGLIFTVLTLLLGYIGALIGQKLSDELHRAGKI